MTGYDYTKAGRGRPLKRGNAGYSNPGLGLRNSERKGPNNPNAKRTNAEVRMMREYRAGGWSHADLAMLFDMSESRCSEICRGKGYPDAGGPIAGKRDALYFSSVRGNTKEKLNPELARSIRALNDEGLSHGTIAQRIYDDTGVEISKSLVGLLLRGRTKY